MKTICQWLSTVILLLFVQSVWADEKTDVAEAEKTLVASFVWGDPTNGFRAGVRTNGLFCTVSFMRVATNQTHLIAPPYPNEGLKIELEGNNGKPVEKTKKGKSLKDLQQNTSRYDYPSHNSNIGRLIWKIPLEEPIKIHYFNLMGYFKLEEAGLYHIMVAPSIYIVDSEGKLVPVTLPPVSIQVFVTQADLAGYKASKGDVQ